MAPYKRRIREHRLVMAKAVGRPLKPTEHVDHRNRDKSDNRLANLALYPSASAHQQRHRIDRKGLELDVYLGANDVSHRLRPA
jgi:hypothetical protein